MGARGYEISLLVFNSTSHSLTAHTRELLKKTLEENFHIHTCPCITLYLINFYGKHTNKVTNKFTINNT